MGESKYWSWFGKISAVIFFAVAIISLYITFNPDTPKIKTVGEYYDWPTNEVSIRAESYWKFDIENTGGEIAKNIRVDMPFVGKFVLGNSLELKEIDKGKIQIGDLQPGDKITLKVWSSGAGLFMDTEYRNQVKVIHDSGVEKIRYPAKVYGILAWIINNGFILLAIAMGVILFLILIILDKKDRLSKN